MIFQNELKKKTNTFRSLCVVSKELSIFEKFRIEICLTFSETD